MEEIPLSWTRRNYLTLEPGPNNGVRLMDKIDRNNSCLIKFCDGKWTIFTWIPNKLEVFVNNQKVEVYRELEPRDFVSFRATNGNEWLNYYLRETKADIESPTFASFPTGNVHTSSHLVGNAPRKFSYPVGKVPASFSYSVGNVPNYPYLGENPPIFSYPRTKTEEEPTKTEEEPTKTEEEPTKTEEEPTNDDESNWGPHKCEYESIPPEIKKVSNVTCPYPATPDEDQELPTETYESDYCLSCQNVSTDFCLNCANQILQKYEELFDPALYYR